MDTHFVVCWAHRRTPHRETPLRYRCREHHLPDLTVTGTSRRPPYREQGVRGGSGTGNTDRYGVVLLCRKCRRHMTTPPPLLLR